MLRGVQTSFEELFVFLIWPIHGPVNWIFSIRFTKVRTWGSQEWIKAIELVAVVIAFTVFIVEFLVDRPRDRAVREATLFAQMAAVHALGRDEGARALKPTVLALVREGIPIKDQNLKWVTLIDADLRSANFEASSLESASLYSADFRNANLIATDFSRAILVNADLQKANLTDANFAGADLKDARFDGANLTWTKFGSASNLRQHQLDSACADPEHPPIDLPKDNDGKELKWRGKPCVGR